MLLFNCGKNSFGITVTNISKHLMLLFNTMDSSKRVIFIGFQNISCYCLTQSHLKPIVSFPLFQNISCYCLTTKPLQSAVPRCGFQNISCYCLTFCHQLAPACFLTISKHLMLLFNCVYCNNLKCLYFISKHLMLLFNRKNNRIKLRRLVNFKTSHVIV